MSGNAHAGAQGGDPASQNSLPMGSGVSFDEVWRDLRPRLVAMLVRRGAPRDVAEDVAQETAIRLLKNWHLLDETRPTWPFARRVALNCLVDRHRRERFDTVCDLPDREGPHDVEEHGLARFRLTEVWRAMAGLTQKERSILLAELGVASTYVNDSATKMARHRARRKLTAAVGRSGAFSGVPLAWRRFTGWLQLHGSSCVDVGTAAGLAVIMSAAAITWGSSGHARTDPHAPSLGSGQASLRTLEATRDPEAVEVPTPRPTGEREGAAGDVARPVAAQPPSDEGIPDRTSMSAKAGPARAETGRDGGAMYVKVCTGEETPMTEDDMEVTIVVPNGSEKPAHEGPPCKHGSGEEKP